MRGLEAATQWWRGKRSSGYRVWTEGDHSNDKASGFCGMGGITRIGGLSGLMHVVLR